MHANFNLKAFLYVFKAQLHATQRLLCCLLNVSTKSPTCFILISYMDIRLESSLSFTSPVLARKQLRLMMTQPEHSLSVQSPDQDMLNSNEEIREVSTQLSLIRKRHDEARKETALKKAEIEQMKLEIKNFDEQKQFTEADSFAVQHRIDQLTLVLDSVKLKHEEEIQQQKIYDHMLDRMKTDSLFMEIESNEAVTKMKGAKRTLQSEAEKARRIKEEKFQSKQLLSEFKEFLNFQKRKRDQHLQQLEKNVRMRQAVARRREEARHRQAEIAEEAAAEGENVSELQARDSLALHRLFYRLMKYKLDLEKEGSAEMERAYKEIRLATGLNDIVEMTNGFLNRQKTYQNLLTNVAESESKLDEILAKNAVTRQTLKNFQLSDQGGARDIHTDMQDLERKIAAAAKDKAASNDQLQNSALVYDSVLEWTKKIMRKLDLNPDDFEICGGLHIDESTHRLSDLFTSLLSRTEEICDTLVTKLDSTKEEIEHFAAKETDQLVVRPT